MKRRTIIGAATAVLLAAPASAHATAVAHSVTCTDASVTIVGLREVRAVTFRVSEGGREVAREAPGSTLSPPGGVVAVAYNLAPGTHTIRVRAQWGEARFGAVGDFTETVTCPVPPPPVVVPPPAPPAPPRTVTPPKPRPRPCVPRRVRARGGITPRPAPRTGSVTLVGHAGHAIAAWALVGPQRDRYRLRKTSRGWRRTIDTRRFGPPFPGLVRVEFRFRVKVCNRARLVVRVVKRPTLDP